jgi:hypothetical protein
MTRWAGVTGMRIPSGKAGILTGSLHASLDATASGPMFEETGHRGARHNTQPDRRDARVRSPTIGRMA